MSGVIQTPLWLDNFPAVDNNPNLLGFTVAIYDIGCLLGALWCMLLGDRFGRKKSCILGGCCVVVGVIIQVTAFKKNGTPNGALGQFLVGRIITGTGNGMNMASMPMYQAEVSNSARGFLVLLECGLIATGTSTFDIVFGTKLKLIKSSVIVLAELRSPQLQDLHDLAISHLFPDPSGTGLHYRSPLPPRVP
ncbi:hypothetical protein IMSHALPRED_002626 [Imshaugia aleurites]|uniref:Major facilitator superfamily (MFS) profile domain-containing protein n=1 Tax=Imshaugia aleurites TaxID=172621 RepID=A0A8H3IEF9_9LECA|nr:hypothetical protein IMSHALPRED_002626 [Imshaugia aleurites]